MKNKQEKIWSSDFGRNYTDRNVMTADELDELYRKRYGVTRTELNKEFIGGMDRNIRILEVGANMGNQLVALRKIGFKNLFGIELQFYPIKKSKTFGSDIPLLQASAFHLPFKDGAFDMIFTSTVLIHIAPEYLKVVMKEICRCTKHYVCGLEYYNKKFKEINYRGKDELLWKGDYSKEYLKFCPDLQIVKEKKYKYLDSDEIDTMFLLVKRT